MSPTQPTAVVANQAEIEHDLESAISLIEQLGFQSGRHVSRSVIRDAVQQASAEPTGSDAPTWDGWLMAACRSLGLRGRVIECQIDQAVDMAANGARIIIRCDDEVFLAVAGVRRGRLTVLRPAQHGAPRRVSIGQFRAELNRAQAGDSIRCIVVESGWYGTSPADAKARKPLRRLWALLQPEWPDIWIVIVFALTIGLLTLATPLAVETLVNTVAFGRFLQPLVILSLMLLTFLAFSAALRALQTFIVEIIQRRLFARVVADIAYRLPSVRLESLDGRYVPELVNRFFEIVVVQKVAAQLLLDGVSLILVTVIGMALLAFYHPWLLGFDVLLLAMISLIVFVLGRGAVNTSIKESKTKYSMAAWLEELAACPTAFRCEGSAQFALERTDLLTFDYLTARAKHFRILMRQIVFALSMQAVANTVLLGLGGWLVISGQLTLGQLVASELIVAVIVGSFAKLGKHMESFYDVLASVDKLGILFDLPVEQQEGMIRLPTWGPDEVKLQDVGYRDGSNGQLVLNGLSLTIRSGDHLAITGPSGSGKSTLLDLLFGLRMPTEGEVMLRGIELRELRPDALRREVSLVRDIEVFEGSLAENVRLGRPNVSLADVRAALANVGLLEDVIRLPQQMDTQLARTGAPLGSTNLRRMMIARACAATPGLLLIDGTLDALPDADAEAMATWLCQPEHPWKLVLVTGRETLAAACNRRIDLGPANGAAVSGNAAEEVSHA